MNIYQKPDSLSLSGNLKDIILTAAGSDAVPFTLSVSAGSGTSVQILERMYSPDENGRIVIDIRQAVKDQLSFLLKYDTEPWQQPQLARTFTWQAGDLTAETFTAIRAGIDNMSQNAGDWLTANFLTWQPTVKRVAYSTPELLTYHAQSTVRLCTKVYYPDGTSERLDDITLAAGTWTIPVSYAVIAARLELSESDILESPQLLPGAYDIWIENTAASPARLTYVQRYVASSSRENEQWVLFLNSLGGVDCFRAYGIGTSEAEHEHQLAEVDEHISEYRTDTVRRIRQSTGWLNREERRWLLDFFPASERWICRDGVFRPIVLTEDSVSYSIDNMPAEFEFTFRYASAQPYLNIPRLAQPQTVINIKAPDLQSFSLPPRLVEFPRLDPSEGALIPVQSPYSEHWAAISVSDLTSGASADIQRLEQAIGQESSERESADSQLAEAIQLEQSRAQTRETQIEGKLDDMFTKETSPARIRANYPLYSVGNIVGNKGVAAGGIIDPDTGGGGGGGEPDEYIKRAAVSNDGNTLTLTKKDDTTVVFSPETGGGSDLNVVSYDNLDDTARESLTSVATAYAVAHIKKDINIEGVTPFSTAADYKRGDVCSYQGYAFRFIYDKSPGAWELARVEQVGYRQLLEHLTMLTVDINNLFAS